MGVFSPRSALENTKARIVLDGISAVSNQGASKTSRSMRSWIPWGGSPTTDLNNEERATLTSRSRDAYRNQPIARAAITRVCSNVVGSGLRLQCRLDHKVLGFSEERTEEIADSIESEFRIYADSPECDAERTLNLYGMQNLSLATALMSGDSFIATPFIERPGSPYGLKLQVIESDRISNPGLTMDTSKIIGGVELDTYGAPLAYYIQTRHPGDLIAFSPPEWKRAEVFGAKTGRRRIMHIFNKERPGQVRGAPLIAPIMEPLKKLDRYRESELMAAVISSMFTVFIKTEGGQSLLPNEDTVTQSSAAETKLGTGAIVELNSGESIETANPGRPNPNYDPFVSSIYREIGACLGIPVDELLLDYRSSYSAARAAMLQAWRLYIARRQFLGWQMCQPIYELWLDEAVARGRVNCPGYGDPNMRRAYAMADWRGPARGAIDETKEATAANMRVDSGFSTVEIEAAAMTGEDWRTIHKQRATERRLRVEDNLEPAVFGAKPESLPPNEDQ